MFENDITVIRQTVATADSPSWRTLHGEVTALSRSPHGFAAMPKDRAYSIPISVRLFGRTTCPNA